MRLPSFGRAVVIALSAGLGTLALPATQARAESVPAAAPVPAGEDAADMPSRLVVIGVHTPDTTGSGALAQAAIPDLPAVDEAGTAALSAILQASKVASFATGEDAPAPARTDALFLRVEARAQPAGGASPGRRLSLVIGDVSVDPPELGLRLAALSDALAPQTRPLLYLRISGQAGRLAAHAADLRKALSRTGFALVVIVAAEEEERTNGAAVCRPVPPPDLALAAGLPDRVPFGDGDGVTTMAEALAWLEPALARPARRQPECAGTQVLILHDAALSGGPVIEGAITTLPPELEQVLAGEAIEAHVLTASSDPAAIEAWLSQCHLCPAEGPLGARAVALREEAATRAIEAALWEEIAADTSPARIRAWLATCRICAQRDLAEKRLARLDAEEAALDAALAAGDADALSAWLADCIRCERRDEAVAAEARLREAEALIAPCLAAAGLPQSGGPRQLDEIDIPRARAACAAATAARPGDALLRVLAARVEQADGHGQDAALAYDDGVAAGVPAAYGLAAYLRLMPPEGIAPDPDAAAALAQAGAERGDWLSREVLILLYSRALVADHDPAEAVAIARDLAGEGDIVADFFLGYFLQNGIGTEVDDAGAVQHLSRAFDAGYARAAPYLAQMIESGRGIEADPERAAALLWSALEAGDGVALELLTTQLSERPREVIRIIQENLRAAGALSGAADGRAGPATRRAVEAHAQALSQQG